MTIHEAIACKTRGMTQQQVLMLLIASHDAQLRADTATVERAYATTRPAFPFEMVCRPRVAYEYNGR